MSTLSRPAIFLDRDDTLMPNVPYLGDPSQVRAFHDAEEALTRLRRAGFALVMVSNQSGVGRGYITHEQVRAVNEELFRQLAHEFDGIYNCYEDPNNPETIPESGVSERKPSPVLAQKAAKEHGLELNRSFFIGDRIADIRCGHNAGCTSVLLTTNTADKDYAQAREEADFIAANLTEATDWILDQLAANNSSNAQQPYTN